MGNCLKVNNTDDISLLREGTFSHDTADFQNHQPSDFSDLRAEHFQIRMPQSQHSRSISQFSEEEKIKISKRICLIQHLPIGSYDDASEKSGECVICMLDFCIGDPVRYLPCMHIYHVHCIDDWLMRSLTCPCCLEPVDAALLTSYENT